MTDTTTIQITTDTKKRLDKRKHQAESYDTAVNRILDDNPGVLFTQDEIERIATDMASQVIDKKVRDTQRHNNL